MPIKSKLKSQSQVNLLVGSSLIMEMQLDDKSNKNMRILAGKVALITGGTPGIGLVWFSKLYLLKISVYAYTICRQSLND